MKPYLLASSILLFVSFACTASAETVQCEFTSWKGGTTDEVVISWLGVGFSADVKNGKIASRSVVGYYKTENAQLVRTERFTGFVYYLNGKASDGTEYRNRYSYRVYKNGTCEGRIDTAGYYSLIATGRVKK